MEGKDLKPFIELNGHSSDFSSQHGTADLDVGTGGAPAFQTLEIEQQIDIDAGSFRQRLDGMKKGAIGTYIRGHKIQSLAISVLTNHFNRGGGSKTKPL
jgi:hypothetical protein